MDTLQSSLEDLAARHRVPGAVVGVLREGDITIAATRREG